MHKIIFKNSETGTPEDWTQYLSDMSSISRRVESENAGEAGVVVYDNLSVEFECKSGTPIYNAFNGDLSSIQRYIIEVWGIKSTGVEVKMFEGLVDFSSLEWPDNSKKISFDVLDKLSALDIIAAELPRVENTLNSRILSQLPTAKSLRSALLPTPYTFPSNCNELIIYAKDVNSNTLNFTDVIVYPGEYIQDPQTWGNEAKYYYVKTSYLRLDDDNNMVNHIVLGQPLYAEHDYLPINTVEYLSNNSTHYLCKEFYGIDINIVNGNTSQGLDALKIIEAIFRKAWSTTPIINKTGSVTYSIPLEYATKLIDENPFSKHPLDALKMLADSMECYIFINRLGELVIQKKTALATNGTTQTLNDLKKIDGSKKYFWDKLVDKVEITVNSWVVDEETGEYLQGANVVSRNQNIKARNSLSKEFLVISTDGAANTQEELNDIAALKASEYYNFYGNRHFAYPIDFNIYDDVLEWELLDNLIIDGEKYFFEALDLDMLAMHASVELVSTNYYPYNPKQAHVIVGEGNESSYNSTPNNSSPTGSTVVLNKKLTNLSQLDNSPGLVVQISDYGFTKRSVVGTADQVSVANGNGVSGDITISLPQNIHTAASPQFAGTKLTSLTPSRLVSADVDNNLVSTNASAWITGTNNQVTVTDDLDGSVTISLPQDIHTAASPQFAGTKLTSLIPSRLVSADANNNLVSTNASAWIAGTNNQVTVTDDLDGTVTLSLPQDINQTANVRFNSLGLGSTPLSGYAIAIYGDDIGTNNFASETTGWQVNYTGNADFRSIYADEMRVKAFTADIEQALAGSDILAKSVAILSENFTIPSINSIASLKVDDLPGFNNIANFEDGDWIRLRIFDRSSGGLTVGDVWGIVLGYVDNADDTQSWTFRAKYTSYANLVGKIIYKGSIVLDYGTSGQGIIERTVLGTYAPYSQMTTWTTNPYTASNYSIKLREGNLSGITDADFGGALSGYGLYAIDNVYLKGKMYAIAGSNVAGWVTTADQFKSPTTELGVSGVFATTYLNASTTKMGLHLNLDNVSNSNDEWISVGSVLTKDGSPEANKYGIAYKSYLGTYFELTNSEKNIAGWNFDTEKFTKGNARIEASASFSGLGVTNGSVDLVKIGNFSGLNPTLSSDDYTSSCLLGYNFNSTTEVNYWSIVNNTGGTVGFSTLDPYEGTGSFYIEAYNSATPKNSCVLEQTLSNVSNVIGKEMTFEFMYQHFDPTTTEPEQYLVEVRVMENLSGQYYFAGRKYLNPEKNDSYNTWLSANISAIINPSATAVKIEILFGGTESVQMSGLMVDTSEVRVYNTVHTFINEDGFLIKASPDTYIHFDGSLNISASEVKVRGFNVSRWIGSVTSAELPYLSARGGEIAFVDYDTSSTIKLFDGSFWRSISGELVGLGDTNIVTPILGQVLKFDGTNWVNSSAIGGTGSGDDADLLDGQHGSYYLDWNNTTGKPSPIITLGGDATGAITLTELAGGILTVSVVNDSHTHDTRYYTETEADAKYSILGHTHDGRYYTETESDAKYSVLGHAHDDRYFTETEITTNYYDKTYIDANFTTTTNQYSKWILTDGNTSFDVLKDNSVSVDGTNGITININPTTKYLTIGILGNTYAPFVHTHDDRYFTEAEITTNYYDKTYIDANFTTTTNLYSKWILTDGVTSRNVVKDDTITFSTSDGVTATLVGAIMTFGITANTYSAYGHNHDAVYLGISANAVSATKLQTARTISLSGDVSGSVLFDGTANADIVATVLDDSHIHDGRYYTETELDGGQLDNRYYTETESDSIFMPIGGGSFTGNIIVGSGTDAVDRYVKVITGDNNIASIYAVGNSGGHGNVFVGENINFGGGIFFKGANTIPEPHTVDAVSFYRKNYTSEAEVFYYNVLTEGVHFNEEIYAKGITSSVATGTAPFTIASTTLVNNLNADLWDGNQFADYLNQGVRSGDNVTFGTISSGAITSSSIEPTNLADGCLPYKSASSLINSPIYISGTDIYISNSSIKLDNNQNIKWGNGSVNIEGSDSTNILQLYTSNVARITVSANGNILIGKSVDTGQRFQVEGSSYFSDTISLSASANISNNYVSGILGGGWQLNQDTLEIDNIIVRNALRTHIFQKDVVKSVNGYLYVSDSGVIVSATATTVTFRDDKSASLNGASSYNDSANAEYVDEDGNIYVDTNISYGTEVWAKDVNTTTGEIVSVKFKIGAAVESGGTGNEAYTTYEVEYTEGVYSDLQNGMTATRISGSTIMIDASSQYAPYIDIMKDGVLVSRMGNLAGVISTSFGQLDNDGLWISRLYAEDNVFIKGHLEATSGKMGLWEVDGENLFSSTDIVLDAFNKRITLSNGAMGFGYDIGGANKHGIYVDANNFWYSSNLFRIGGLNGIDFDGTSVTIGSDTKVRGTVSGGDMVVAADGSIQSADYVANQEGWKLSNDGFENNEMRQFELLEGINAGTPVKIVYDGTTARVAKLRESNLTELNDNTIYNNEWVYSENTTTYYLGDSGTIEYKKLNSNQLIAFKGKSQTTASSLDIYIINFNDSGVITSHKKTSILKMSWSNTTPVLKWLVKLSDTTLYAHFYNRNNTDDEWAGAQALITIASDGTATMSNGYITGSSGQYTAPDGWSSTYYFYSSLDSTHVLNTDEIMVKLNGSTYTFADESTNTYIFSSCVKTSDGKIMAVDATNIRIYSISGDTVTMTETALTRTDVTPYINYYPNFIEVDHDKYAFIFKKDGTTDYGIYVISHNTSANTVTQGNSLLTQISSPKELAKIADGGLVIRDGGGLHVVSITASLPSYVFNVTDFIDTSTYQYLQYLGLMGTSSMLTEMSVYNNPNSPYETESDLMCRQSLIKETLGSTPHKYPTYIKTAHNKILRFSNGNLNTASDFAHFSSEKFAVVRHENFGSTDYLMFTIIQRDDSTGYSFFANDLIVASANIGTYSKIQKISDTHFLVKNGAYIYLIKFVGTTLSLIDTYYDTAITNYNQAFAELIAGTKYVFMGASKAIILDIAGDNLTATSYATTTSTLIANIVGIADNQWVGAYPFNSGGYKATYRIYTFSGTAVTYTDLINTTLVDSTKKIYLAPLRGNVVLSLAILSTGNGVISIEELYSTGAATQDSREYPSHLFPTVDGLQRLNSEGYGGILGDNIVHIVVNSGKLNTRFATNIIDSTNTIDNRSITSATSGNMLLYVKGNFIEDNTSGGQDAIVIDVINDSFYVDGIMEQTGTAGQTKKVAMAGDETRVFSNLVPGTRYGLSFDYPEDIVEDYDKELILAVEIDRAIVL